MQSAFVSAYFKIVERGGGGMNNFTSCFTLYEMHKSIRFFSAQERIFECSNNSLNSEFLILK